MARYSHLPIFQKAYDLTLVIYRYTAKFKREYKYTLGAKLKDTINEFLDWAILANSERKKTPALKEANMRLERLRIYVRLGHDLEVIGIKKYEILCRQMDELGRMLGGWMKKSKT